jgi:hypothetical protein
LDNLRYRIGIRKAMRPIYWNHNALDTQNSTSYSQYRQIRKEYQSLFGSCEISKYFLDYKTIKIKETIMGEQGNRNRI